MHFISKVTWAHHEIYIETASPKSNYAVKFNPFSGNKNNGSILDINNVHRNRMNLEILGVDPLQLLSKISGANGNQ